MKCSYFVPVVRITGGTYPLRDDCCRCHDHECPDREECQRWTDRDLGNGVTPHAYLMRKGQEPLAGGAP